MKTRTRTKERSSSWTDTVTVYGCDHCDFESDSEAEVKRHCGQTHAIKETKTVADLTFYRFDTQEDRDGWFNYSTSYYYNDGRWLDEWTGPGWYAVDYGIRPCSSGCCDTYEEILYPAAHFVDSLIQEAVTLRNQAQKNEERAAQIRQELGL